jgi:hypothetical protein
MPGFKVFNFVQVKTQFDVNSAHVFWAFLCAFVVKCLVLTCTEGFQNKHPSRMFIIGCLHHDPVNRW